MFSFMTSFHYFAFKTETSWAKKAVKSSLEIWNCVCLVYLFSDKKKQKKHAMLRRINLNAQNLQ